MRKIVSMILCLIFIFSFPMVANANENNKLSSNLIEVLNNSRPEDLIGIYLYFNEKNVTVTEMPSWPNLGEARKALSKYYDEKHAEYFAVIFDTIEYEEVHVSSFAVIVRVKAEDVWKLADYDIVRNISFYKHLVFEPYGDEYLFKSSFLSQYDIEEPHNYKEVYYHYDQSGEVEWCLVKGEVGGDFASIKLFLKFDNFILQSPNQSMPFDMKYAVYDVKNDNFVDLVEDYEKLGQYEGLIEVLRSLDETILMGDSDKDGELTVLDATRIQRALAQLESLWDFYTDCRGIEGRFSDYDGDGELSVLDATGIQMKLAKIEGTVVIE